MTGLSLAASLLLASLAPVSGPLTSDDGDQGRGRSRGQAGSPVRGVSPGHTGGAQEVWSVNQAKVNINMDRGCVEVSKNSVAIWIHFNVKLI